MDLSSWPSAVTPLVNLQSRRWMLHPNPHSLLRPACASSVGKTIPVLRSGCTFVSRDSPFGSCLLLACLERHHAKSLSLWRGLFDSASRCRSTAIDRVRYGLRLSLPP